MYFFYYIPTGLDVGARKRAFVSYFICGVCATLFIIYRYAPFGSWWDLARLTFQPAAPSIATAITHAFLHGGYFHLIGNLVYLLVFGPPLEDKLGSFRFFIVFAASAAAGVYLHLALTALYSPENLMYGIIGASGATSGILGASMVRLYFSRVRVAYWVFMPLQGVNRAGRVYLPVVCAVLFWFILQGVRVTMQYGIGGMHIAYSVHLGGFAGGALLALCFRAFGEARAEKHLVKARRHFEGASWFAAQAEYLDYLALKKADADAHAELARTFICGGDTVRARSYYVDAVRLFLERGARDAAETLFSEALRHMPNFALPEELHLDLACGMERTLKFQSAMQAYEHFVWRYPLSKEAPFVLLRMAGMYEKRFSKPEAAYTCYRRLTNEYSSDRWAEHAREEITRLEGNDPFISLHDNK